MTEKRITSCYSFGNGMVMTFDQFGKQMPEYQGHFSEVLDKIRAAYDGPIVGMDWNDVRESMLEVSKP